MFVLRVWCYKTISPSLCFSFISSTWQCYETMNFDQPLFLTRLTKWKTRTYFQMLIAVFFLFCNRVSKNSAREWNSHKIYETLRRFWFRGNSAEGCEFAFTRLWCGLRYRFFEVNNSRRAQKISQSASTVDRKDQSWQEVRCHLLLQQGNTPL